MEQLPVETTTYSLADALPSPSERRDGERHLTIFRVGSIMVDGQRELCLIKNISAGGMLIRAYSPFKPGMPLSIELKCGQPVSGSVRWVEGSSVGVAFDQPIDVVELLATSMEGPRPRMPRVEVQCTATLREESNLHRVRAVDVSQGGLKLACEAKLRGGAHVVVTLQGLAPQAGIVRWCEGGYCGVTFNRVIPLAELVGWLQEQRERLRVAS